MRILHLASYSLYSGPLPSTLGLAQAQQRLGHTVWFAYDTKRGAINEFEEAATPWVEQTNLKRMDFLTLSAKSSPREFLQDLFRLRNFVRENAIDIVHAHLSHDHVLCALSLPRRWPNSLLRTIHSERSLEQKFSRKLINQTANGWIVRCETHRETLQQQLSGKLEEEQGRFSLIRTIAGGIDSSYFQPAPPEKRSAARKRFGINENALVIGHVALMAGRGQEELVEALALVAAKPNSVTPHILFVGKGENEAALREQVKSSTVAHYIHFAGYLQGEELNVGYAAMDAVFCAQAGNDASARAILEGMSSALPPIAVQVGALADTVSVQTGYPVPDRTPNTIAEAIMTWTKNPQESKIRGAQARKYVVSNRSFDAEAHRTLALYDACLSQNERKI